MSPTSIWRASIRYLWPLGVLDLADASGVDLSKRLLWVGAHLLTEAFQQLWEYNPPAGMGKLLDDLAQKLLSSGVVRV